MAVIHVAYCFAEKKGYSKFGSYTGNGNADGTFVYTGFKPAFVMVKKTSAGGNWVMFDNKRDILIVTLNTILQMLIMSNVDTTGNGQIDIIHNGFKIVHALRNNMKSTGVHISGMAFATSHS